MPGQKGSISAGLYDSVNRPLIIAWWILALAALGLATAISVVLVVARMPFLSIGTEYFRTALVLHVNLAVVVWFMSAAAAFWVTALPLWDSVAKSLAWAGFGLATFGALLVAGAGLAPGANPILANYIPVLESSPFLFGLGFYAAGLFLTVLALVLSGFPKLSMTEWKASAGFALFSFVIALAVMAVAQLGVGKNISFDDRFWGVGHVLQSVHTQMVMAAWLLLGQNALNGLGKSRRFVFWAVALTVIGPLMDLWIASVLPVGSMAYRQGFTNIMRLTSWPGPLLLCILILYGLRRRNRHKNIEPTEWGMLASMALFGLGALVGATIRGETTSIPAHYHGTVGAVTLAYMLAVRPCFAWLGIRVQAGRYWERQPYVYAIGIGLLVVGLGWSGWLGIPRKATHAEILNEELGYWVAMGIAGIGGLLAMVGAGMFVYILLRTLSNERSECMRWLGMKLEDGKAGIRREEKWRILLLTLAVLVIGGVALNFYKKPRMNGLVDSVAHVEVKRKAEIDRRFKEGVAMLQAKQYEFAMIAFHRVLELAPSMPEAYVNAGYALLGLGKPKAAKDFFDAATSLKPNQLNAYFGLAEALEALGDDFGSMQAMETYVHLAPKDDPFRRKAEAAAWELRTRLQEEKSQLSQVAQH